jgi:regulator of sirC expression with transglutaminase-like and TPR domain
MSRTFFLATILVLTGWCELLAQPAEKSSPTQTKGRIQQLIADLDHDSYAVREAASRELVELGDEAIPAMEAAQKHDSAEVRYRATAILARLKVGPVLKIRRQLAEFAAGKEELDVEQGMFLISLICDEKVKKADLTRQLDEIAAKVREKLGKEVNPATAEPAKAVAALREVLFTELGFGQSDEDYQTVNHCSLAKVLETKKGMPIMVSHLMVAVARRLEIPIVGLPLSGMYIVKYDGSRAPAGFPKEDIYLHPFKQGRILSREDRQREFPSYDPDVMIPPGTSRATLSRMLVNLQSTLATRDEPNDSLRRDLVSELSDLLDQTDSPAAGVRIFRGGRAGLPIGDY